MNPSVSQDRAISATSDSSAINTTTHETSQAAKPRNARVLLAFDVLLMLAAAGASIAIYITLHDGWQRWALLSVFLLIFAYAAYQSFLDRAQLSAPVHTRKAALPSLLLLLDEEGRTIEEWPLLGKVALVIGKNLDGQQEVDIDLQHSPYASFIETQHAVFNYAGGEWFIEDLYSDAGVRVQKHSAGTPYRLTRNQPCRIEPGDILYIANSRLLVR